MRNSNALHYLSGEEITIGDQVSFGDSKGVIVFVIPSSQYSIRYTEKEWSYLKEGFGVETEKYGVIHQVVPDEDLILMKQKRL